MNEHQIRRIDHAVCDWMLELRTRILNHFGQRLTVQTKTGRKDLVTNVDKENEKFYVEKIHGFDPQAKILGEEGFGDQVNSLKGRLWIVDPIDGTMNFVKQHDHFAMMVGVYEDGEPVYGAIMDVMNNVIYHGGPQIGVFANGLAVPEPENLSLSDGLMGMSASLVVNDVSHMQAIEHAASGMRIYGSAGLDIIAVLAGENVGYISYLKPWDIAAGRALLEPLGLVVSTIDGNALDMLSSNLVLVATKQAQQDILKIVQG
ncbi:inositol monophosphatase family protein [Levilactobacillus bambusae]|nr:inositol monophosphatase family protein [Levilactobacillus bambusae]